MRHDATRATGALPIALRGAALVGLLGCTLATALPAQLSDGVLDPTFASGGIATLAFDVGAMKSDIATALVHQPGDRLLLAGSITTGSLALPRDLAAGQLTWSGGLDTAFGGGDGRVHYGWGILVWELVAAAPASQGKTVLAGSVQWSETDSDFLVVRLLPDGSLDPGFGGGTGWVSIPFDVNPGGDPLDFVGALYVLPGDGIVVAGTAKRSALDWDFAVARLTATGALHSGFGGGTGKVVLPIDAGGYPGRDQVVSVFPSADGALVLVGYSENGGANNFDFAVAEIDFGGNLVSSFGVGGRAVISFDLVFQAADLAAAGALDPRGRILVAGSALGPFGRTQAAAACLTPAGALCPDFGSAGRTTFPFAATQAGDEKFTAIAVDDLGRLILAGTAVPNAAGNRDVAVARLLPNGALDPSFAGGTGIRIVDLNHGPGGDDDEAFGLVLAAGKPVVVGATQYLDVDDDFFALRLWVSLVQADGFERGTHEGWSHSAP